MPAKSASITVGITTSYTVGKLPYGLLSVCVLLQHLASSFMLSIIAARVLSEIVLSGFHLRSSVIGQSA
jgi:hypothetical protein